MIKPAIHSWGRLFKEEFHLLAKSNPERFNDMLHNRCSWVLDCETDADVAESQEFLDHAFVWLEGNITNFWYIDFMKDKDHGILRRRYVLHFAKKEDMITFKTSIL